MTSAACLVAEAGAASELMVETLVLSDAVAEWYNAASSASGHSMFKILEKPTANDLLKMFEEYDTDTLRALVDKNGDIYAWPFDMAMHAEVKKRLGLGDDFEHVIIAKEDMAPPGKRAAERSG